MTVGFVTPRAKRSVRTVNSDLHFGHAITVAAGADTGLLFFSRSDAPPFVLTSACADATRANATAMLAPMVMLRSDFICLSFFLPSGRLKTFYG
jgi:hypothetical protein